MIQVQDPVRGTGKWPGHADVKFAEYAVLPLGEPGGPAFLFPVRRAAGDFKGERDRVPADVKITGMASGGSKSLQKTFHHIKAGEGDGNVHGQVSGFMIDSHTETGQPPVALSYGKQMGPAAVQFHGDRQHLTVRNALKKGGIVFLRGEDPVGLIDTNLPAGVDSILSFPKFDQPGPALVIKIDGLAVKDHVKMDGRSVVEGTVSEFSLPGIHPGSHNILVRKIGVSEGTDKFIQKTDLLTAVHAADLPDDLTSS